MFSCEYTINKSYLKNANSMISIDFLLRPIAPGGTQAIDNRPRQRTRIWAFRSASFQLYRNSFSSASVSRRQLFLPLGFPPQCLPGDVVWCFPQGVTNQAPFSSQNLFTHRLLFLSLPKLLTANFLRPPNVNDARVRQLYMKIQIF